MEKIEEYEYLDYPILIWTQGMTENFEYTGSYEATEYESLNLRKAAEIVKSMPIPSSDDLCPSALGSDDGSWSISRHAEGHYLLWTRGRYEDRKTWDIEVALEFLVQMYLSPPLQPAMTPRIGPHTRIVLKQLFYVAILAILAGVLIILWF